MLRVLHYALRAFRFCRVVRLPFNRGPEAEVEPETEVGRPASLLCADRRLKGYIEAWPQQIVRIRELHGHFGRLRCRVELVGAGDESTLVRILVAGRQDEAEFTPLGDLLNAWECFAALKIHGGRRLADH